LYVGDQRGFSSDTHDWYISTMVEIQISLSKRFKTFFFAWFATF